MKKIAILSSVALAMIIGYSFTSGNSNKLQKLDTSSADKTTSIGNKQIDGAVIIIFIVDGTSATAFPGTINSHYTPTTIGTQSPKAKLENLVKNY